MKDRRKQTPQIFGSLLSLLILIQTLGCSDTPSTTDTDAASTAIPVGCADCYVITSERVFDGSEVRPGAVAVRGDRIEAVAYGTVEVVDGTLVDYGDHTVLPGLIDLHVHMPESAGPKGYRGEESLLQAHLKAALRAGVTTLVDLGSSQRLIFELRRRLHEGVWLGPRFQAVGPMLTAPGGHPCTEGVPTGDTCMFMASEDEVVEAFAKIDPQPGDLVKIMLEDGTDFWPLPRLDFSLLPAIVAEAKARQAKVIAHLTDVEELEAALVAGITIFTHMPTDATITADLAARVAAAGMMVVPTLSVFDNRYRISADNMDILDDPDLPLDVPTAVITSFEDPALIDPLRNTAYRAWTLATLQNALANLRTLYAAGVTIAAGTDSGLPGTFHGLALRQELALYVEEIGMTPVEALRTSTSHAADLLGQVDVGRLTPGAAADLLVVEGDPTVDIHTISDVHAVWRAGVLLNRDDLAADRSSSLAIVPVADLAVGEPCLAVGECGSGAVCNELAARCSSECQPQTAIGCDTGNACFQDANAGTGGICIQGDYCDLFTQDCTNGAACVWAGNGSTFCWFAGPGVAGDSCETLPCAPGYQCSLTSRCYRLCDPQDVAPNCPVDQHCQDLSTYANLSVGQCVDTP